MRRSGDKIKFAVNHDNEDDLVSFHKIHPDLAKYSRLGYQMVWHSSENKALDGDRRLRDLDLPWFEMIIPIMCREAYNALRTRYCPGNDALVTARLLNTITDVFGNYNGRLVMSDLEQSQIRGDDIFDVKIEVRDLIAI